MLRRERHRLRLAFHQPLTRIERLFLGVPGQFSFLAGATVSHCLPPHGDLPQTIILYILINDPDDKSILF
jgi:hypothetical protein